MSFDLGVWYSDVPMSGEEAGEFYVRLDRNRVFVRRYPQFDAFWEELNQRFPDLRSPDDPPVDLDALPPSVLETPAEQEARVSDPAASAAFFAALRDKAPEPEDSPWAATLSPSGASVVISIVSSRVGEVATEVLAMAKRHGLLFFDPQELWVWFPPELEEGAPRVVPPLVTLEIAKAVPELKVTIRRGEEMLLQETIATRQEAHGRTRALTLAAGNDFYDVDDPGSAMAQLFDEHDDDWDDDE
jgi:hypothetical protein